MTFVGGPFMMGGNHKGFSISCLLGGIIKGGESILWDAGELGSYVLHIS